MAKTTSPDLRTNSLRVTRLHFYYVAAYLAATMAFDSWNLITHDTVERRWVFAVALLVVVTLLWFASRIRYSATAVPYQVILFVLFLADVGFACANVYEERGMASKSVVFFVVPLLVAAFYRSRTALLTAATLCSAAYVLTTVIYFYHNYGEGFKIELYGGGLFYSAVFFIVAWLLQSLVRNQN